MTTTGGTSGAYGRPVTDYSMQIEKRFDTPRHRQFSEAAKAGLPTDSYVSLDTRDRLRSTSGAYTSRYGTDLPYVMSREWADSVIERDQRIAEIDDRIRRTEPYSRSETDLVELRQALVAAPTMGATVTEERVDVEREQLRQEWLKHRFDPPTIFDESHTWTDEDLQRSAAVGRELSVRHGAWEPIGHEPITPMSWHEAMKETP